MQRNMVIDGKRKAVFVLEEGPAAYIVIEFPKLIHVDYRRLKPLSEKAEKQGMSMMKLMSETRLDNGKNALAMYKDIITVVYKPGVKDETAKESLPSVRPISENEIKVSTKNPDVHEAPAEVGVTRKRGRPKKSASSQEATEA